MTGKKLSVLVLMALLAALIIAPGPAAARATKIDCTGTEVKLVELAPGSLTNPGGNHHLRGVVTAYEEMSPPAPRRAASTPRP